MNIIGFQSLKLIAKGPKGSIGDEGRRRGLVVSAPGL